MPHADVNGTTLHYRLDGPEQGPVVMFSNSLAADLGMWDAQLAPLTSAGFRVLRYDSRGHGLSAAPPGPYTIEMLADDAVGLLDALGLERVHFCGLSLGGMVGQLLGARHPGRLRSLTLCDTSAHMPAPDTWNERIHTVREGGTAAVVDGTVERWFTPAGRERLPQEVDRVRRMILGTPVEGYCACCEAVRDMDQRESIRAIALPALVLVGEQDQATPVSAAEFIHGRISGSQLTVIPDAAHLANIEQSDVFNGALVRFVADHREG